MNRWQLKGVSLYSHDSRRRDLSFELNSVNIITGPSGSGKSAICEIIDYCLGASRCHIPGVVRDATSWVGILLSSESTEVFIARRIPPINQFSAEDTYLLFGAHVSVPADASGLTGTTNVSTMLRRLEQILGIGDALTEVFGAARQSKKVTARNITPFLLQDDDVIINKTVLLRGAQDERRLSIIDTFPYFLGVVDETSIAKEQELRRLRSQYAAEERRIISIQKSRDTAAVRLRAIALEAQQVGLFSGVINDASVESLRSALRQVATYVPSEEAGPEGDRLNDLANVETRLRRQRVQLLTELDRLRDAHREASMFVTTTERQQRRLQVVELFKATDQPNEICPVCNNQITQNTETLENIRNAYGELQGQLRSAERERPQIDNYITGLEAKIADVSQQMSIVRAQLVSVRKQSAELQHSLDLVQQRMRVAGRVSYFLEMADESEEVLSIDQLQDMQRRIAELQGELDNSNKMDQLEGAQQQVALAANDILNRLPFVDLYPPRAVYFNTRDISAGVLTAQRRIPMRDIGSDENYLSLHVAVALGLQRFFKSNSRPVPGFVLFDQLSRPFYPPDRMPGVITTRSDEERGELRKYFDVLFEEVEAQGDLQVIVLEHAFFADDERFIRAVGNRSLEVEKLIPSDWPLVTQ
jgi:hypothetical protein